MRTSLSRTTILMVVAASLAACCVTGCQTTSPSKAASSNWFSWGKKKPANSTLGANTSKPSTSLPAPPSSTASPNPVPSYAQNSPRPGSSTGPTGSGMPNAAAPSTAAGYGTPGTGAGYYANASYGNNAPPATAGAENASAYGRPGAANAAAGAYPSAGTRDTYGQPAGGYGGAAGGYPAAGTARTSNASYGANPAAAYGAANPAAAYGAANPAAAYGAAGAAAGPSAYGAAAPSDHGQAWGGNNPDAGVARNSAAPAYDPRTAPAGGYGPRAVQEPSAGPASSYVPAPTNYGTGSSGVYAPAGGAFGQDAAPQGGRYADAAAPRNDAPSGLNPGGYRPGSTGRATRFGDSQQINVGSADNVQSASYNTARDANSRTTVSDRAAPAEGPAGSGDYDPNGATAGRPGNSGGAYPYPTTTYQR